MRSAVCDTPSVIWHLADDPRLSLASAKALDEACESAQGLLVPTMCIVEVVYLVEKRRVGRDAPIKLTKVLGDETYPIRTVPLTLDVARVLQEIPRETVPDLPDRVIAATARHLGLPLVTRDHRIRELTIETIW